MDPAESGHAQSSDMGPGQQGSAATLISGGSRHWQGPSDVDSEHKEPAVVDVDGVARARDVVMQEVEPGHDRALRGTWGSAARGRRTDGKPLDIQMLRWRPEERPADATRAVGRACASGGKGARGTFEEHGRGSTHRGLRSGTICGGGTGKGCRTRGAGVTKCGGRRPGQRSVLVCAETKKARVEASPGCTGTDPPPPPAEQPRQEECHEARAGAVAEGVVTSIEMR